MQDLPDVVWRIVVDYLRPSFEWDTYLIRGPFPSQSELACLAALASLCRVSSRHHALAERALYQCLRAATRSAPQQRLFAVLRDRPELARHVRALCVEEEFMSRIDFAVLARNPARAMAAAHPERPAMARLAEQIVALGDDLPDFSEAFFDAWSAHIVTLLPGLEFLDITMSNQATLLPSLMRDAARGGEEEKEKKKKKVGVRHSQRLGAKSVPVATEDGSSPLSRLQQICIRRPAEIRGALRMRLFQDVLLLPQLKRIYGQCVDLDTRLATVRTLQGSLSPPNSSQVRDVTLVHSLVETAGLLDLLRTCPLLQKLSITWGDSIVGESQLDWDGFGNALREHGSNLELLDLDCRLCLEYDMGEWSGKIGDLSGLRRLRHLSLPQDILLGNEDELSGLDDLDDDDEGEGGKDENDSPDVHLEPRLPLSLESLRLYRVYDDLSWVNTGVQGLLSSQRLLRLGRVQLDNAAKLNIASPYEQSWETESTGEHLVFRSKMSLV